MAYDPHKNYAQGDCHLHRNNVEVFWKYSKIYRI